MDFHGLVGLIPDTWSTDHKKAAKRKKNETANGRGKWRLFEILVVDLHCFLMVVTVFCAHESIPIVAGAGCAGAFFFSVWRTRDGQKHLAAGGAPGGEAF